MPCNCRTVLPLPKVYTEQELAKFFVACDPSESGYVRDFPINGFSRARSDVPVLERRKLSAPDGSCDRQSGSRIFPKRSEEREVPLHAELAKLLECHPHQGDARFIFPSPAGNREQNMLLKCKAVAERCGQIRRSSSQDVPIKLRQDVTVRLRRANCPALDGTQIARNHDAIWRRRSTCKTKWIWSSFQG